MPVILTQENEENWLNQQLSVEAARALLSPYPAEGMGAYEVSTKVNSPAYNEADLVRPV